MSITKNQKIFIAIVIICVFGFIIYQNNNNTKSNTEEIKKNELYNKILQSYNIKQIDVSTTSRSVDNDLPTPILVSQNKLYYLFADKHGLYKISLRFDKNKLEHKIDQLRFYDSTKLTLSQTGEFIVFKDNNILWKSQPYNGFILLNMGNDGKLIFTTQISSGSDKTTKQTVNKNELYLYQMIIDAQQKHYMICDTDFDQKIKNLMK
jgi:hypothetical protein